MASMSLNLSCYEQLFQMKIKCRINKIQDSGDKMPTTTSDKQNSKTFQGLFKDKSWFSMTKIYAISQHSLTPF